MFQTVYSMTGITKAVVCAICLWDGAYKRSLAANQKEQPMWWQEVFSLAECSFTIDLMPYNSK